MNLVNPKSIDGYVNHFADYILSYTNNIHIVIKVTFHFPNIMVVSGSDHTKTIYNFNKIHKECSANSAWFAATAASAAKAVGLLVAPAVGTRRLSPSRCRVTPAAWAWRRTLRRWAGRVAVMVGSFHGSKCLEDLPPETGPQCPHDREIQTGVHYP